jgi:hypothetical protein
MFNFRSKKDSVLAVVQSEEIIMAVILRISMRLMRQAGMTYTK